VLFVEFLVVLFAIQSFILGCLCLASSIASFVFGWASVRLPAENAYLLIKNEELLEQYNAALYGETVDGGKYEDECEEEDDN
jgi:hypothetical protein